MEWGRLLINNFSDWYASFVFREARWKGFSGRKWELEEEEFDEAEHSDTWDCYGWRFLFEENDVVWIRKELKIMATVHLLILEKGNGTTIDEFEIRVRSEKKRRLIPFVWRGSTPITRLFQTIHYP
jgi:hypothetical protein